MGEQTRPSPQADEESIKALAEEVVGRITSKNPGLLVTGEVCEARTQGITDQLTIVKRLIYVMLGALLAVFLAALIRG